MDGIQHYHVVYEVTGRRASRIVALRPDQYASEAMVLGNCHRIAQAAAGRECYVIAVDLICPRCGRACARDEADVGVGLIFGPWGCYCGWSERSEYNLTTGPKERDGYVLDQWGGATPSIEGKESHAT